MASRSLVAELDASLRRRPLIGQHIGETILEEVESEGAAQVIVGWRSSFASNEYAFGSNLLPVLTDATVDVTPVNPRGPPRGRRGVTRHGRRPEASELVDAMWDDLAADAHRSHRRPRHELADNSSLNQELHFIEQVNEWIETGKLPAEEFTRTEIHRIQMGQRFHCSTKVDRSPRFIEGFQQLGMELAHELLSNR